MPTLLLLLAAIAVVAVNVYGWRVISDEARIPFRLFILGSRETTSKTTGLVMWLVPELLILAGLAVTREPGMRWVAVGLLSFYLLQHFFTARRLRSPLG